MSETRKKYLEDALSNENISYDELHEIEEDACIAGIEITPDMLAGDILSQL